MEEEDKFLHSGVAFDRFVTVCTDHDDRKELARDVGFDAIDDEVAVVLRLGKHAEFGEVPSDAIWEVAEHCLG